jgi:hypothetical protein
MMRRGRTVAVAVAATLLLAAGGSVARCVWAGDAPAAVRPRARTLKVRVWEPGAVAPTVSVNVPVVLVTVAVRVVSLCGLLDHHLHGTIASEGSPVRLRAADIVAAWDGLVRAGPAQIVSVDDGGGERVEIRLD